MRSVRQSEDLTREPRLDEALADPVIQAVMARDRVSRDDVLRVVRAAQARLRLDQSCSSQGVVTPFPVRAVRGAAPAAHPRGRRDLASIHVDEIDVGSAARRCRGGSVVEE